MQGTGDQRSLLSKAQGEVLLELALILSVVPKTDRLVLLRQGQENGSLQTSVEFGDFTGVEAVSHEFVVDGGNLFFFLLTGQICLRFVHLGQLAVFGLFFV